MGRRRGFHDVLRAFTKDVQATMRIAALALLATTPLPAQTLTPFGSGCGTRGTELSMYGSPSPGEMVELELVRARPLTVHLLVLGTSNTVWAGGSLPWVFSPSLGFAPACALLVAPDVVWPWTSDDRGRAELELAVPLASGDT